METRRPVSAKYNLKTNEHILRICIDSKISKSIIFHEFTHILDADMYAKNDPHKYVKVTGYTEYHASQVELMVMLGANKIQPDDFSFTLGTEIKLFETGKTVENYLNSRHQLVIDMMSRTDFPRDIEALKTTIGVLYNYFGLRSICQMYAEDYHEKVDNTVIIKKIPSELFEEINSSMVGWFNQSQVEASFITYKRIIEPMLQKMFPNVVI